MPQENSYITIPDNLDGLEEAVERVLSGEDKLLDEMKEKVLHARIRNEYRLEKNRRGRGHARQIKEELSLKYFNSAHRIKLIEKILYYKY